MMSGFLEKVVKETIEKHEDLGRLVMVAPNKRSLSELERYPQLKGLPRFLTIQDLMREMSRLDFINQLPLLFTFYEVYKEERGAQAEHLDVFFNWGQTLLNDFSETDKYKADKSRVFADLRAFYDVKNFLTESTQKQAEFYLHLETYYERLTQRLLSQKMGYEGLVYKTALEHTAGYLSSHSENRFVFVGFNALSRTEEEVFQAFLESGRSDIYWDIDRQFMEDAEHEAGVFLRKYKEEWPYYKSNPFDWIGDDYASEKKIFVSGVSKSMGQAVYVSQILKEIKGPCAVVLGDETLATVLTPMLPEKVDSTLAAPLRHAPLASFFRLYLTLYTQGSHWYYKDVIKFMSHPVLRDICPSAGGFKEYIYKHKKTRMSRLELLAQLKATDGSKAWEAYFPDFENGGITALLSACLLFLEEAARQNTINDTSAIQKLRELFLYLTDNQHFVSDVGILMKLFNYMASEKSVVNQGDPNSRIHMMGMLETRNLDFETVIITSLNEGTLPSSGQSDSFIPYELRRKFKMPLHDEREAVYAYHFYRLLQRAKDIYLIYDSDIEGITSKDKSRYILQLEVGRLPTHELTVEQLKPATAETKRNGLKEIWKDDKFRRALEEKAKIGFSPSALTQYIYNPLQFYLSAILGFKEELALQVEASFERTTFGTVIHQTLEKLYKPFEGKHLEESDLADMRKRYLEIVQHAFDEYTPRPSSGKSYEKGKNYILYGVISKYVELFLESEFQMLKRGNEIQIIKIETNLENIPLQDGRLAFPVNLKGKIDRIDRINGQLRIVDYKTGRVEPAHLRIENPEEIIREEKYTKLFQILLYGLMLHRSGEISWPSERGVRAGIVSFRTLRNGFMNFRYGQDSTEILTPEVLIDFEKRVADLVLEIANLDLPITEKPTDREADDALF